MSLVKKLRQIALASVMKPDDQAYIRHIMREYSREYNTPLHEVEALPLDYILLHYFEGLYYSWKPDDIEDEARKLLETESERHSREAQEEAEVDLLERMAEEEAKHQQEQEKDLKAQAEALKKPNLKPKAEEEVPEIKIDFVETNL